MAKYLCEQYPSLIVGELALRFVDGVVETGDPVAVARLDRIAAAGKFGVSRVDGTAPASDKSEEEDGSDVIEPPRGNASTADWRAYALSQGIEVGEDETRDEIRARFE